MLKLDPIREARQLECIDKWEASNYNGIADWYPGTGKTYLAILAIQRIEKMYRSTYVISVPNEIIYKQWIKTLESFPIHLKNRIIVITKGTLLSGTLKYKGVGLFIIDEVHEYTSEKSEPLLDKSIIEHKMFLGLTGTTNHANFRNVTKHYNIIDTVTEYEAKSKGFIAEMIEYNYGLTMTKRDTEIYENYTKLINELMVTFDNNLMKAQYICYGGVNPANGIKYQSGQWAMALAMKKGWSNKLDLNIPAHAEIDKKYNPSSFISQANLLLTIVNRRKRLLSDTSIKQETVVKLLKRFPDTKTIVFSESTKFADRVGLLLNEAGIKTSVFHSKIKTQMRPGKTGKLVKFGAVRLKREAIEGLTTGSIKVLSTTRSLDKGLNIPDLRFSIITSGTSSIDQETQRKARAGRKEAESDDPVLNVNLYIKDTQDEVWLRKRQENNNSSPIFVDKLEDIVYKPQPNYFNYDDL
jgi:superfamily II DNA or RNA helicase